MTLAFDNMAKSGPRGSTDWQQFSIQLDVPAETVNINSGLLMSGKGKAWFDALEVELNGNAYQNDTLFDFDFESNDVKGFALMPMQTYRTELDDQVVKTGKRSLRMESIGTGPANALPTAEGLKLAEEVLSSLEKSRDKLSRKADLAGSREPPRSAASVRWPWISSSFHRISLSFMTP